MKNLKLFFKSFLGVIIAVAFIAVFTVSAAIVDTNTRRTAFGEGDPKGRIKNLAAWKKPAVWVSVVAAIVLIAAAVCLLTDRPEKPMEQDELKNAIITEDGYTIRSQMVHLSLRVPKDVLTEAAYTLEGQSFGQAALTI